MTKKIRTCTVPGCGKTHKAHGLCRRHYGMAQYRDWLGADDMVAKLAALDGIADTPAIDVSGLGETAPGEGAWVADKEYWEAPFPAPCPAEEVRTGLQTIRTMCAALAKGCPAKEFKVVDVIAERLTVGLADYGPFREDDPRDWRKEAREEGADLPVYLALELLKELV